MASLQELENMVRSLAAEMSAMKNATRSPDLAEALKNSDVSSAMAMSRQHSRPKVPGTSGKTVQSTAFELVYLGNNDFGVIEGSVYLDGSSVSEDGGAPFSFLTRYVDTNGFEVTADTYGWVDLSEATPNWTMNTGAALPAPASGHQIKPLFKIAWDAVNSCIDTKNCKMYYRGICEFRSLTPAEETLDVDPLTVADHDFLMYDAASGTWKNVTGTELDVVTDAAYSETTGELTFTKRTLIVFDNGPTTGVTIDSEECD